MPLCVLNEYTLIVSCRPLSLFKRWVQNRVFQNIFTYGNNKLQERFPSYHAQNCQFLLFVGDYKIVDKVNSLCSHLKKNSYLIQFYLKYLLCN